MTRTEEKTIRELEAKGYELLFRDELTGVFDPKGYSKLNRKEAVDVAEAYRKAGYKARCVGPNPYDFPFRVMVKK